MWKFEVCFNVEQRHDKSLLFLLLYTSVTKGEMKFRKWSGLSSFLGKRRGIKGGSMSFPFRPNQSYPPRIERDKKNCLHAISLLIQHVPCDIFFLSSDKLSILHLQLQDETHDLYKRQQLRELAMLNSNFREESPHPRGSVSPFGSSGMKRAKTGW